MLEPVHGFGR